MAHPSRLARILPRPCSRPFSLSPERTHSVYPIFNSYTPSHPAVFQSRSAGSVVYRPPSMSQSPREPSSSSASSSASPQEQTKPWRGLRSRKDCSPEYDNRPKRPRSRNATTPSRNVRPKPEVKLSKPARLAAAKKAAKQALRDAAKQAQRQDRSRVSLSPEQKAQNYDTRLKAILTTWHYTNTKKAITKTYFFHNFRKAWRFMLAVALKCKHMRHYPAWSNTFNKVTIYFTSHDVNDITNKDVKMAEYCDELAEDVGLMKPIPMQKYSSFPTKPGSKSKSATEGKEEKEDEDEDEDEDEEEEKGK